MNPILVFLPLLVSPSFSDEKDKICDVENEMAVISTYSEHKVCDQKHIKDSLKANVGCKPSRVVLELPWPNSTDIQQMTPTHVEVLRCEGGCHQTGHSCIPTSTSFRKVPVMFGKCGHSVGKCEKECAHVTIEEHTQCRCACDLRQEECESEKHSFHPELCRCECRDSRAKRECLNQGRTWSERSCLCGCPLARITECPVGFTFDFNNTCTCVALITNEEVSEPQIHLKEEVEQIEMPLGWQTIIIITLISILMILSLITIILVIKLKKLKHKQMSNQSLVPSTLSGQYFPCSDPCSDLVAKKVNCKNLPSLSDSDSERCREHLTDSSLCSEEKDQWNELSEGSSESLANARQNRLLSENCQRLLRQSEQCLEPVGLNHNLAIRSKVGGSGTIPSNYNTVRIVYRNGERTMELNCEMEHDIGEKMNITSNPMMYNM